MRGTYTLRQRLKKQVKVTQNQSKIFVYVRLYSN